MEEAFTRTLAALDNPVVFVDGWPRSERQTRVLPEFTEVILLRCRVDIAVSRQLARGREDDDPALIERRTEAQMQGLEPWAAQLAGPNRVLNTSMRTRDAVFEGVNAYLKGKKREVY
jgi:adenylate kinase family enzyme